MTQHARIQTDRRQKGKISLAWFLVFFVCDLSFCSRPETKLENRFLRGLIHRMSVPGYCIPRGIKLQNVSDFPYFNPKMGVNGHFQA